MSFYHPNIHRGEHIKANGTQCGSTSLRHKKLCFFHDRWQTQRLAVADSVASIPAGISIAPALNLPVLEDANSIQVAIMQVLHLLLTGQLQNRTASLSLYALKLAIANLRRAHFEPYPHNVVINPATVSENRLGEEIWKNSDFNPTGKHAEKRHADKSAAVTDEATEETKLDDAITVDGQPQDAADEPDHLGQDAGPAPQSQSAPRSLQEMSDALPPNWREEVRSQIAGRVLHSASKGTWIEELIRAAKSDP